MSEANPCLYGSYLSLSRVGNRPDPGGTVAEGQRTHDHLHCPDTPTGTGPLKGHVIGIKNQNGTLTIIISHTCITNLEIIFRQVEFRWSLGAGSGVTRGFGCDIAQIHGFRESALIRLHL